MSSGNATTSRTEGLSPQFGPYLQQYAGALGQVAGLPYQQYNGPRVANLSGLQRQSLGGYGNLLGSSGWGEAGQTLSDLGSGSMNPFTDQVVNRVQRPVIDAYNSATAGNTSRFNSPGNFGSDRQNLAQGRAERNLSQGLGDATGQLYANAYESNQQRRLGAVGAAGNLASTYGSLLGSGMQAGDIPRQQQQSVYDALYGDFNRAQQYPESRLNILSGGLGALNGAAPRDTTTTGPGSDRVAQGVGMLALSNSLGKGGSGSGVR